MNMLKYILQYTKFIGYILFNFVVILSWIVDGKLVPEAVSGRAIINEEDVETQPEKVPASILDENVFLNSCRKYFTHDTWACVEQLIICLQKNPVYYCGRCTNPIN